MRSTRRGPLLTLRDDGPSRVTARGEAVPTHVVTMSRVGHLGNVATVLSELAEKLDPARLLDAGDADFELPCVRRLGYVLELAGQENLAGPLARRVKELPEPTAAPPVPPVRERVAPPPPVSEAPLPPTLSRRAAAKALAISTKTLDRRVREGAIKPVHLGGRTLFPRSVIEELLGGESLGPR